jgi:site-specific recombinase XerD
MTSLTPTLQAFFTERLMRERRASPHTIAAYRDSFRLLLSYIASTTGKTPATLDWADIDAATVGAFLHHLEAERGNSARTRNARLSAIHSFFRFAALRHPEQAELIQRVLTIPEKRFDKALVCYLTRTEVEALLTTPDRTTWTGERNHALILLAVQTGLRVSELTALRGDDVVLGTGAHVRCYGKGRKERCTPLTKETVGVLRSWMQATETEPEDPLFPSRGCNRPLTRSAVWRLVAKHALEATELCPSLAGKRVTPHTLRHTCAMGLLESGVDLATIALWLGHSSLESTNPYLHADMALKERALARTTPANVAPGRYRPTDDLLAFLKGL